MRGSSEYRLPSPNIVKIFLLYYSIFCVYYTSLVASEDVAVSMWRSDNFSLWTVGCAPAELAGKTVIAFLEPFTTCSDVHPGQIFSKTLECSLIHRMSLTTCFGLKISCVFFMRSLNVLFFCSHKSFNF